MPLIWLDGRLPSRASVGNAGVVRLLTRVQPASRAVRVLAQVISSWAAKGYGIQHISPPLSDGAIMHTTVAVAWGEPVAQHHDLPAPRAAWTAGEQAELRSAYASGGWPACLAAFQGRRSPGSVAHAIRVYVQGKDRGVNKVRVG